MENSSESKYRQPKDRQAPLGAGESVDQLDSGQIEDEATAIHSRSRTPYGPQPTGPGDPLSIFSVDDGDISEATIISSRPSDSNLLDIPASNRVIHAKTLGISSVMAAAQVLLGKTLDHFELLELIGGGGMGAVFRARDTRLDRIVAVKVIPAAGQDPEMAKRFKVEAQSAARLDHPNIARVYYVGEVGQWSYIVFEYVDGINLRDLVLTKGLLSIDEAVWFTRQVAEALTHAAARFVVHRDIKPSNVLVTKRGLVKLVDMGLARTNSLDHTTNDLTASNVTLGTFDYISPEQARDPRAADVRSDLYSLGCTLYFLLSGKPPFPNGTALEKLMMHGNAKPVDLRQYRADVSSELVLIVKKLMEKNPSQRYQEPIELINDLYLLAEFEDLPKSRQAGTVSITPTIEGKTVFESLLPWMVAIGLLCGVVLWMQNAHRVKSMIRLPREQTAFSVTPTTNQTALNTRTTPDNAGSSVSSLSSNNAATAGTPYTTNPSNPGPVANSDSKVNSNIVATGPQSKSSLPERQPDKSVSIRGAANMDNSSYPLGQANSSSSPTAGIFSNSQSTVGDEPVLSTSKLNSDIDDAAMLSLLLPSNQASAGSSSSSAVTSTQLNRDTVVVVDSSGAIMKPRGWKVVRTLQEAMMIAAAEPLRNQVILMNSVELNEEISCSHPSVTIRSGGNQRSRIRIAPRSEGMPKFDIDSEDLLSGFSLTGQSLQIVGVDIVLQCPESSSGLITSFRLAPGSSVEMIQSTLTMLPSISDWRASAFSTPYAIDSTHGSASDTSSAQLGRSSPLVGLVQDDRLRDPTRIHLQDCIIRGNGDFLYESSAQKTDVQWDNGLLAINGRMLEYGGARFQGRVPLNIRLQLKRVTTMVQRGFSRLNFKEQSEYPVCLSCTFESCSFLTDADAAFFEFEGVAELNAIHAVPPQDTALWSKWLDVRGMDNAYDTAVQELIRLRANAKIVTRFDFEFAIRHIVNERAPESDIRWISTPAAVAPYRQTAEDYLQRPGMFQSGMDPNRLPVLKKTDNSSLTEG